VKRFLVLYKSSTPASEMMAASTPEQIQAGMEDWQRWSAKAGDAIVDLGPHWELPRPSVAGQSPVRIRTPPGSRSFRPSPWTRSRLFSRIILTS
jgi:hypothetical protein